MLPRERELASSALEPQGCAAVTDRRLLIALEGEVSWQRQWHEIASASWDTEEFALVVRPVTGASVRLVIPDHGDLRVASTARRCVEASVVTWRTVTVTGGSVQVVVRRRHDGSLLVQELAGGGVDVTAAPVRSALAEVRIDLAHALGQPHL